MAGSAGWRPRAGRTLATLAGAHQEASVARDRPGRAAAASHTGSVDDDEHLAAYNAYLARLNKQHDR